MPLHRVGQEAEGGEGEDTQSMHGQHPSHLMGDPCGTPKTNTYGRIASLSSNGCLEDDEAESCHDESDTPIVVPPSYVNMLNDSIDINNEMEDHKNCGHSKIVNELSISYRRVKLYEVDSDTGEWCDKGTGHFYVIEDSPQVARLIVQSEEIPRNIYVDTVVRRNRDYTRQKDSIITWQDGENLDLYRALSFQHPHGCFACWEFLQAHVPKFCQNADVEDVAQYHALPVPSKLSLDALVDFVDSMLGAATNCELAQQDIIERKWLREVFRVMNKCLEAEDVSSLKKICYILRKIVIRSIGEMAVLEVLFSDEFFLSLLKSFEYDRDLLNQRVEMQHVEFFQTKVKHWQAIEMNNPQFSQAIHLHYRISYFKDVVLPRHLDEGALIRLTAMLGTNMLVLINLLLSNFNLFAALKRRISEDYMAGLFLREFIATLRSNQFVNFSERQAILNSLKNSLLLNEMIGYLDGTSVAVQEWNRQILPNNLKAEKEYKKFQEDIQLSDRASYRPNPLDIGRVESQHPQSLTIEIINFCCDANPSIFRQAIFYDTENSPEGNSRFLKALCDVLLNSPNEGVQSQVKDIFCKILHVAGMELPERDEICGIFYDKGVIDNLLEILFTPLDISSTPSEKYLRIHFAKIQILDILSLCVHDHKHRFKMRIQSQKLPSRVIMMAIKPHFDKFLAIAAVKFLRACVQLKDSFVAKHFCQNKVLRPVLWILTKKTCTPFSRSEGSLLESAFLDFLSFANREENKMLVNWMLDDALCLRWLHELNKRSEPHLENTIYAKLLGINQKEEDAGSRELTNDSGESGTCEMLNDFADDTLGVPNGSDAMGLSYSGRPIRLDPLSRDAFEVEDSWFQEDDEDDMIANEPFTGNETSSNILTNLVDGYDEDDDAEIDDFENSIGMAEKLCGRYDPDKNVTLLNESKTPFLTSPISEAFESAPGKGKRNFKSNGFRWRGSERGDETQSRQNIRSPAFSKSIVLNIRSHVQNSKQIPSTQSQSELCDVKDASYVEEVAPGDSDAPTTLPSVLPSYQNAKKSPEAEAVHSDMEDGMDLLSEVLKKSWVPGSKLKSPNTAEKDGDTALNREKCKETLAEELLRDLNE